MATLALESAVLLSSGFDILLTWRSAAPTSYSYANWYEGYQAGKWIDCSASAVTRHVGTCAFIAGDGTLEWQTHVRLGTPIVWGTSSATVSIDAGWLKDKYGNQNGGYANQALDVTRTLVGSDGFRSQSMTLSPGAVKVYVDPVGGSNASVSTAADLARIQSIGTPALTHKFAQDTIIASGLQHAGCWIMYIQGKTETRDHTAPYPIIDIDGPSPAFPSLLGVCGAGGGAATARALMSLSNAGVAGADLNGIRREGGGGRGALSNLCVDGFNFVQTDATGTAVGAGIDINLPSTNMTLIDCRAERMPSGFNIQANSDYFTLHRCIAMDAVNVSGVQHPIGLYADYVTKGLLVSDCDFDRCGKRSTDLTVGDTRSRNVYIAKLHGTGPVLIVNTIQSRSGSREAVQNRTGTVQGGLFIENPGTGFFGGKGAGGWSLTTTLEAGDFLDEDLVLKPCSSGPYINNSTSDELTGLPSDNEAANSTGMYANVVYPETGTIAGRGRAFSCLGSNLTTHRDYEVRNNISKGVGPGTINSDSTKLFASLLHKSNVIDNRGANNQYTFQADTNYGGVGWSWFSANRNGYFNDTAGKIASIVSVDKTLGQMQSITGQDADASGTAPVYADTSRTIGTWAGVCGLTATKAAFYTAIRDRAYRVWGSYNDAYAAFRYFQAGLNITNYSPYGTGILDMLGPPNDLPTTRFAEGSSMPLIPQYKLSTCGIIPIMRASGRRTRLLVISDRDTATTSTRSWDGWWFTNSTPSAVVGIFGGGELDLVTTTPVLASSINTTGLTVGTPLWPFYRTGQGPGSIVPEGKFYDTVAPGTGANGIQGSWMVNKSQELIWPSSSPPADNQELFHYSLNGAGDFTIPWQETDALTGLFIWHQPAVNGSAILGGPKLNIGYSRDFDSPTVTASPAAGTTATIRSQLVSIPAASGSPNITISQPTDDNLKCRMTPLLAGFESATASQGITLVMVGVPNSSPHDWDPAGNAYFSQNEATNKYAIGEIVQNGLLIHAAIVNLSFVTHGNDARGYYFDPSDDYDEIVNDTQSPPSGHYVESFEDVMDTVRTVVSPTFSATLDPIPIMFVASPFVGYGDTVANAATYLQRMEAEFINSLDRVPGNPLYSQYGLKSRSCYVNPWYDVSPTTILTGTGASKYIRRNGTSLKGTWTSGASYVTGDVICRTAAAQYWLGNSGWYVCLSNHTSAASGVNGPPEDVLMTRWIAVDFALNDNGMQRVVDFVWSQINNTTDQPGGGSQSRSSRTRRLKRVVRT